MIYSENVFDGITYSPATSATTGDTINIAMVPTVYAVTPDRGRVVPCSNLASARAVRDRLNGVTKQANVSHPLSVERSLLTPEQLGGCRTGGCGYDPAVTWALTGRVERVHNWGTAKSLASDYPVEA